MKLVEGDIATINAFESLTKTRVIDYLAKENEAYFVVAGKSLGAIIGKDGVAIKAVQQRIGKKIRVFRYSAKVEKFAQNIVSVPVRKISVTEKSGVKIVRVNIEKKYMPLVMGRDRSNLAVIKELMKRRFAAEIEIG